MSQETVNPFLTDFEKAYKKLNDGEKLTNLFDPSTSSGDRALLWGEMCQIGESLVDKYAWAVPIDRAISLLKEFSPIVEVGCGSNAYWGKVMEAAKIDVRCYDNDSEGGKINKKRKLEAGSNSSSSLLRTGGPEVLQLDECQGRNLFLCFPDEEFGGDGEDLGGLGLACLDHFRGQYVIHVGELFGDAVEKSMSPFGRSSSPEFQTKLGQDFHCLVKIELPSWPHEGQTFSVWKRTKMCEIVFGEGEGEGDDDDDVFEEASFKNIPKSERLPLTVSSPALRHLSGLPCAKGVVLTLLEGEYVVMKFPFDSPAGMEKATGLLKHGKEDPVFVAPTCDEISVICHQKYCEGWEGKDAVTWDDNWSCFKVKGPMPFYLVGVMASLSTALAAGGVSLLAQSTFDTDYVLVKTEKLAEAKKCFEIEGCILK